MKVTTQSLDFTRNPGELGVVFALEKEWLQNRAIAALDHALGGTLADLEQSGEFRGERGELVLVHTRGALPMKRLLLAGLGTRETLTMERIRTAAAQASRRARAVRVTSLAVLMPDPPTGESVSRTAQAITESAFIGIHRFREYRAPDEKQVEVREVTVGGVGADPGVDEGVRIGEVIASSVLWAREMALHPGNVMTPVRLSEEARSLSSLPGVTVELHDRAWIEEMKMGGIVAVTQGSHNPPRFVAIHYRPRNVPVEGPLVFVGKGVTFDSGGISLKDRENMGEMKTDMSGAAAVIASIRAIAQLGLPSHVVGLVPMVENLPGGGAFRPGDVVRFRSGKTAEIISTDAEGRMILADALDYGKGLQPQIMVDLATLTGAMVIALGHVVTGFMGTDPALNERLKRAGEVSGDRLWELPLWPEYRDQIKSEVADLKNSGGRPGGAIAAGWFLAEFAEGVPWAHLDIAGTASLDREISCFTKGPTGVGVRLLVELVRSWKST